MIARNLATRIENLEVSRRRPDELLLVWRHPNGNVSAAARETSFTPGDRVICLEWFGDSAPPPPRWFGKRAEFSVVEDEYFRRSLSRSLTQLEEGSRPWDTGFADIPDVSAERICELHDNDLLHMIFGVAT